jgi:hypothetical protein
MPALRIAAVILFERYEQKDKSGKLLPSARQAKRPIKNNFRLLKPELHEGRS